MTTEAIQNGIHDQILSYTSYSLLGLSSLALIATLIALVSFREIRKSYNAKIHISLTAVLLAGNTVFIAGIERVENSTICTGVAIALHYIWLCVFGWTLAESYNMYLLFIRILNVHSPKFVLKLAVPAMCIPMVVVAVSVGMSPGSYGTDQYCALHGDVVYYGFAIPIGLVVVINTAIFCLVLSKIFKKTQYQNFDGRVQKALSQIKAIVTLSCLLGLTWVFGFLTFRSEVDIVFHYLFIICNGLQGVVIFICHVAIKPDVRHIWMTFLCNGDTKSAPGSRTTTPTRSRGGFRGGGAMNSRTSLFSEFFTKRSSTVTLSTTATKLSLTKQLTRQRTESLGSLNIGVMHHQGPRKSLAPLEEKESSATNPVSTPGSTNNTVLVNGKLVLKPMLSNHSCDEMFEHIVPESTTFLASVQDPTNTPASRGGLPRNLSSSDRLSQLSSPASNTSIHSINKKRISVLTAEITRRSSVDHVRGEKVVFTGVKLEDRLMVQHRPPSAGKGNRVSPMDDEVRSEERKKVILEKLQQLDEFIF